MGGAGTQAQFLGTSCVHSLSGRHRHHKVRATSEVRLLGACTPPGSLGAASRSLLPQPLGRWARGTDGRGLQALSRLLKSCPDSSAPRCGGHRGAPTGGAQAGWWLYPLPVVSGSHGRPWRTGVCGCITSWAQDTHVCGPNGLGPPHRGLLGTVGSPPGHSARAPWLLTTGGDRTFQVSPVASPSAHAQLPWAWGKTGCGGRW